MKDKAALLDRARTCPLLIQLFVQQGRHHTSSEYGPETVPRDGISVYTWRDATLRELSEEIKERFPFARDRNACLEFSLVYPNAQVRARSNIFCLFVITRPIHARQQSITLADTVLSRAA